MGLVADKWHSLAGSLVANSAEHAGKLIAQGREVLDLTSGEPDFDTPQNAANEAHRAIDDGDTKYTATDGSAAMKQAVQFKLSRDNHLDYPVEGICIGCGAKSLVFHTLFALLDQGDEVIVPTPAWSSFPGMVELTTAHAVLLECPRNDAYKLSAERLDGAITARTKCLIINNPSNPTGAVYTNTELRALGEVLERYPRIAVIADEIYEHLVYGVDFTSFASANPGLRDRTICINGASKGYAMTGWRIGYACGPIEVMEAVRKLLSQSTGNPSSVSQRAVIEALRGPQDMLRKRAEKYAARRDHAISLLQSAPGLVNSTPQGAFYLYPDCRGTFARTTPAGAKINNSDDLCHYFLESQGVATVSSTAFYATGNFRISYACADEVLDEACRRIVAACQALA